MKTAIKYCFRQSLIQYGVFLYLLSVFCYFFIEFFVNKNTSKSFIGIMLFDGLLAIQIIYLVFGVNDINTVAFAYPPVITVMTDHSFDETRIVARNIISSNLNTISAIAGLMLGLLGIALAIDNKIIDNNMIMLIVTIIILNSIYYFLQIFKMVVVFDALGYHLNAISKKEENNNVNINVNKISIKC